MPLSYSQVQKDVADVVVPMYGGELNIKYYPSKMTDDVFIKFIELQKVKGADAAKDAISNMNTMLSDLIKEWDFFEDDEQTKMWPTTPEGLSRIDITFKVKCLTAIVSHVRPEEVPGQKQTRT